MAYRKLQLTAGSLSIALALVCGACSSGGSSGSTEEMAPVPNEKAPDHFKVRFDTSKGPVLIQVIFYRWDNRYTASVLKKYPRIFRGVARVNPEDPAAPDHLSELMGQAGFHGVRISPAAGESGNWIAGPLRRPRKSRRRCFTWPRLRKTSLA